MMISKTYYRYTLVAQSAFSIGRSDNLSTDADILVDGTGAPFIPASTIAGVFRHSLDDDSATEVFGSLEYGDSPTRVYDATLVNDAHISVRDNVSLAKDDKVAADTAKFDRQVVDAGARFTGYLEVLGCPSETDREAAIETCLSRLDAGELRIGAKTTRGLGQFQIDGHAFQKRVFDTDAVDAWLDFDMFDESCWNDAVEVPVSVIPGTEAVFDLELEVTGALSIRHYVTNVPSQNENAAAPDYEQLSLASTGDPIIPGTTWAGAFRSAYRTYAEDEDELFGHVGDVIQKSRITFSESIVSGGEWQQYTRNAIDRFTGGTLDGALFTEKTHYGGATHLQIRIQHPRARWIGTLSCEIADLDNGFLAVGGLTAVGHGLFSIKGAHLVVNGIKVPSFDRIFDNGTLACPDIPAIVGETERILGKDRR